MGHPTHRPFGVFPWVVPKLPGTAGSERWLTPQQHCVALQGFSRGGLEQLPSPICFPGTCPLFLLCPGGLGDGVRGGTGVGRGPAASDALQGPRIRRGSDPLGHLPPHIWDPFGAACAEGLGGGAGGGDIGLGKGLEACLGGCPGEAQCWPL